MRNDLTRKFGATLPRMSFVDTWHAVLRAGVSLLSGLFADGPGRATPDPTTGVACPADPLPPARSPWVIGDGHDQVDLPPLPGRSGRRYLKFKRDGVFDTHLRR